MGREAFRRAVETHFASGDGSGLAEVLAEDVTFKSPVVFNPYEGREAVGLILAAVGEVFEDFRYVAELDSDEHKALIFQARVGDREVEGLDLLRFNESDEVAELTVMVRPMSGMHALAEAMRAKLEAAGAV